MIPQSRGNHAIDITNPDPFADGLNQEHPSTPNSASVAGYSEQDTTGSGTTETSSNEPTSTQDSLQTGTAGESPASASQQSIQTTEPESGLVWFAGHEEGNLNEWQEHGGFVSQGSGTFRMISPLAHSGSFSVALTIDTLAPSSTGSHASYLFFWDRLEDREYYYSAWYYIPSGITPASWWNIWQWKSTSNHNSNASKPIFALDAARNGSDIYLWLYQRPDQQDKVLYQQTLTPIPRDAWFHIEAYYKRGRNDSGEVIIWQDGEELFRILNVSTVLEDETIYWSLNNYTDAIDPNPCTIFIDDAVISITRIGTEFGLD